MARKKLNDTKKEEGRRKKEKLVGYLFNLTPFLLASS
jgi:hypothetical protein